MRPVWAWPGARPVARRDLCSIAVALALALSGAASAQTQAGAADDRRLVLAASSALEESGLLGHVLSIFQKSTGIDVTVRAQPAGAALKLARDGTVDAVLLDSYDDELKAVEDGVCVDRRDIMYTDLVLVGPRNDPAGVEGMASIIDAAKLIANSGSLFVARGDQSAVASTERDMWTEAGVTVGDATTRSWYIIANGDMVRMLSIAVARSAYALTDRPSWLRLRERGRLQILVQDDPRLVVQYGAMAVNPARHPGVHAAAAKTFVEWLSGKDGQAAIVQFKLQDEVPYVPNYGERPN